MKDEKENKTLNQWLALNQLLRNAKLIGLFLGLAILIQAALCLAMFFSDPTVIAVNGEEKCFFDGKKEPVSIEKEDIKKFVKGFIKARYSWSEFNRVEILTNIGHFVTEGFSKKLKKQLKKEKSLEIKGKTIRQVVADIKVQVTDDSVTASFYKLLVIQGVPLPVTTQLAFKLTEGKTSRSNRIGIYINGILEHESKER